MSKTFFATFYIVVTFILLLISYDGYHSPLVNVVEDSQTAKQHLDNYFDNYDAWNNEKLNYIENEIEKIEDTDKRLALKWKIFSIKLEEFKNERRLLFFKVNVDNFTDHYEQMYRLGFFPPPKYNGREYGILEDVRTDVSYFVSMQQNKDELMNVAIEAEKLLKTNDWRGTLKALKQCKGWQCNYVLDLTFNTKEKLTIAVKAMKAGVYE